MNWSRFPMPRILDILDAVAGATLSSTFDSFGGYYQIPLKEEEMKKRRRPSKAAVEMCVTKR